MRTPTATTAILLAAALTACSSADPAPEKPAASSSAPALSKAEVTKQCVDAFAAMLSERPADFDPETGSDPKPTECDAVPEDEYLDMYMDGLSQHNKQGQQGLQDLIDDAAEQ
ncbi:hypothetical protein R2B67_17985 [Streptomyces cyaneofuscatus]|uniref:hypothetical protein n=1 Tax=Streptomyces cyaneofuscatus TaxID=66883 RepID=UPI002954595D|nr:hypothetical protein [Streptomyces cyaneofuscatus]WOP10314.1 hypothetical protein R2B67_17985 [Streptomyces cyaneofuscatus]